MDGGKIRLLVVALIFGFLPWQNSQLELPSKFFFLRFHLLDIDLEIFFEATEDWNSAMTLSNSMAFISQFGEVRFRKAGSVETSVLWTVFVQISYSILIFVYFVDLLWILRTILVQPWRWSRRSFEVPERIEKGCCCSTKRTEAHHRYIATRGGGVDGIIPITFYDATVP